MKDYDFKALSPDEFEELARQLLNRFYTDKKRGENVYFQSTPKGKDAGIDLYHSTADVDFEIIVQVKHYAGSSLNSLLTSLVGTKKSKTKSELSKVKLLNPKKYIIVTSQTISYANKQKIKREFTPYIHRIGDILDNKYLNNLLDDYPDIEKNFIKLYFTSAEVMRELVNEDTTGHGEFLNVKIENKIKLYVDTGAFKEAEKMLAQKKVLIITGEPGSGKTTLAEILVYKFLKQKYKLGYILNDINQAEKLWKNGPQIFYYDDFLGQNFYESEFARNNERPLNNFIQKIETSVDKVFVLTTRTIIYNYARDNSERFRQIRNNTIKLQIEVADLKYEDKVKMVYNHLLFKNVPNSIKNQITAYEISQIASHSNFYPRIIDFATDNLSISYILKENIPFFKYILLNLENPKEIWRICYEKQINESERIFINTLFSLGNLVSQNNLKLAFESRMKIDYARNASNFNKWSSFEDCYQSLNEAFVLSAFSENGESLITFINPSVIDFLLGYLTKYPLEVNSIIESSIFVEQFYYRFRFSGDKISTPHLKISLPKEYSKLITEGGFPNNSIHTFNGLDGLPNYLVLYRILLLIMYFRESENIFNNINYLLKSIDFTHILKIDFKNLFSLLRFLHTDNQSNEIVISKWTDLFDLLLNKANDLVDLAAIFSLFSLYDQSITTFMLLEYNNATVKKFINEYRNIEISEAISECKRNAITLEEIYEAEKELKIMLQQDYNDNHVLFDSIELSDWELVNWHEIINDNADRKYLNSVERYTDMTALIVIGAKGDYL